ncbi:DUF3817 domain-containing protein [Paenibacillus sp. IB182496]|uniref:DUF3817 domain-containing protein n=1 Tax=Paenibacillus sabuli TaxID=2772509 RepID=A0A927BW04_9BACL|nr:DUF3817 domain-containing protein [Paenibacillus sabuli]MBD2846770.1 DUF3817 domain-containing protein [Paenibacillus sabuli]
MKWKKPIGRLRTIGWAEGLSFLILLSIAMPMKYVLDIPEAVSVVGMLHGVLFVLYMLAVAHVTWTERWSAGRVAGAILAAFLPFGPFVMDAKLLRSKA